VNIDGEVDRVIPKRAGFRRGTDGNREWLVLPHVWKDEIAVGHDHRLLAKELVKRQMMRVGGDGKPQRKERLPGLGQMRVYVLTDRLLTEPEDDETEPLVDFG
jgi:hypothetical protein